MIAKPDLEKLENELPRRIAAGDKAAFKRALAAGQSVMISDGKDLVLVHPNGTRTIVGKAAPRVPVRPGKKLNLQ